MARQAKEGAACVETPPRPERNTRKHLGPGKTNLGGYECGGVGGKQNWWPRVFVACVLKGWKGGGGAILNFPNSNKKEMQRDFFCNDETGSEDTWRTS